MSLLQNIKNFQFNTSEQNVIIHLIVFILDWRQSTLKWLRSSY